VASVGNPPYQPRRRGGLHHHVLTSPAAVFGTANYQHAELRWHDVETFAYILADPVQGSPQHGQVRSSMSTIISTRGRCAGSEPRFTRRFADRLLRSAALSFCRAAASSVPAANDNAL
jgi:hypothetical protein